MPLKRISPFLALLLIADVSLGQISKGDAHYEKSEYVKAIPYYKKASRKADASRKQALVKLGDSYRKINDWKNAEAAYRQALEIDGEVPAEAYYNYAQSLKVNNKYEEAAEQYRNYIKKAPNDENAKNALKFCTEIKYYLTKPREFTVKNVDKVNTPLAEFSPFVFDHKLMFIAERESFDFVNYPVNDHDGQPFLNMYISNLNGSELKKAKALSKKLNSQYHDGPGCISADGKTLYFTRVGINKKGGVSYAKIFEATGGDKNWDNIKSININNDNYSVAHPSVSEDNNTLFFASDMPGGYGGKDIWYSTREGENWSQPVNLGPDINTTGDEMFPTIRKNGVLYFSSNGLPGFGGLDIYSAKKIQSKWILDRNEGLDLNSSADDFGITFLNDTLGYFSSNRVGGKGKDDIYLYDFSNKSMVIDGTILLTEKAGSYARNKKVILFDAQGVPIDSTFTNEKGYFQFKSLDSEKRYLAVLSENDPELYGKARYFLAENDSIIHRVSTRVGGNKFSFKNLPIDPNAMPDLYTDDDLVFAGTLMSGDKGTMPVKNARLKLVNDFGDVVEETTTNEYGAFAFRNIPTDQNYLVAIEEMDPELPVGTLITLTNKSGKEVKTFFKPAKGERFTFKVLQSEKNTLKEMDAEDVNLVMGLYGYMYDQNKRPITNAKLRVKNEDGSGLQEITTTDKGKFNFENLQAEKEYIFEADENDPALKDVRRIYIADNKGRIYKVIELEGGKFTFKILEVDKAALGEFVVDDPSLKVADRKREKKPEPVAKKEKAQEPEKTTAIGEEPEEESEITLMIVENIYYPYGDWHVSADGEKILDKAVEALTDHPKLILEIRSHTDSQSSYGFNMNLSRKRAEECVNYMVSKGISRSRLKASGFGETRLLNKCADGVPCTEDEHKVNRRTEFRITKPVKR